MKKDLKVIYSPKFHILVIGLTIFQFIILNSFLAPQDFFTICLLSEIMIVGIPLVTELHRKHSQRFFVNSNHLNEKSPFIIKLFSFVVVIVCLWIVVLYHFLLNYLLQDVFHANTTNVLGNDGLINYSALLSIDVIGSLMFFITMLIFSIVITTYFINNFIKNKIYIYSMLILFLISEIVFGPIFNTHLFEGEIINGEYFIVNGSSFGSLFTTLTFIFIPWNYFVFMINLIVNDPQGISIMSFDHFWNTSYFEDGLKFNVWYPYLIMFLCLITPKLMHIFNDMRYVNYKNA